MQPCLRVSVVKKMSEKWEVARQYKSHRIYFFLIFVLWNPDP
jgi:hypothetical protein